ncbi:hypothetical protein K7711_02830 [Nocardia sp. CA2R105]|uniref:hypothetical protein n=1 Tax=Nocardia coffeae TaxID=2873381 RepID=UPI001CA67B1C|nr:hypothetical protein [Nocardia coffeae]MBY8855402.1 hypothetical protein [Nocardia coffeae]
MTDEISCNGDRDRCAPGDLPVGPGGERILQSLDDLITGLRHLYTRGCRAHEVPPEERRC